MIKEKIIKLEEKIAQIQADLKWSPPEKKCKQTKNTDANKLSTKWPLIAPTNTMNENIVRLLIIPVKAKYKTSTLGVCSGFWFLIHVAALNVILSNTIIISPKSKI
jgi:hypothetical protein